MALSIEERWKCGLEETQENLDHMLEDVDLSKAQANSFIMIISKCPKFTFFMKSVEFPDIQASEIRIGMPQGPQTFYDQSSTIEFNPITCTVVLDEKMLSYKEIYDWMWENQFINKFSEKFADGTILHLGGNKQPIWRINFRNMRPQQLFGWTYDATVTDTLVFRCSFTYEGFFFSEVKNALGSVRKTVETSIDTEP